MKKPQRTDAAQDLAEAMTAVAPCGDRQGAKPKWGSKTHYVYLGVFEDRGLAFVKVGMSDNPDRRLGELGTGCPFVLKELFICQIPSREQAWGLEQTILTRYAKLGKRGEWLRMDADKVRPWIASLSVIAMSRFGPDSLFKPHVPRRKYTPGFTRAQVQKRQARAISPCHRESRDIAESDQ